jgi:hypothetical protein
MSVIMGEVGLIGNDLPGFRDMPRTKPRKMTRHEYQEVAIQRVYAEGAAMEKARCAEARRKEVTAVVGTNNRGSNLVVTALTSYTPTITQVAIAEEVAPKTIPERIMDEHVSSGPTAAELVAEEGNLSADRMIFNAPVHDFVEKTVERMFTAGFLESRSSIVGCEDSEQHVMQATLLVVPTPAMTRALQQAPPDAKSAPYFVNAPARPDAHGARTVHRRVDAGVDDKGRKMIEERSETKTVRRGNLRAAAADLAKKLTSQNMGYRVATFFSRSAQNSLFAVAVARALIRLNVTADRLGRSLGKGTLGIALFKTIELYAAIEVDVVEPILDTNRDTIPREEDAQPIVVPDPVCQTSAALIYNRQFASKLVSARVCPFCAAAVLRGEDFPIEVIPTHRNADEIDEKYGEYTFSRISGMIDDTSAGAPTRLLEALAARHNKEQHSLNGNINLIVPVNSSRTAVIGECSSRLVEPPLDPVMAEASPDSYKRLQEDSVDKLVVRTLNTEATTTLQPAPNLHQFMYRLTDDVAARWRNRFGAPPDDVPPPVPPANTGSGPSAPSTTGDQTGSTPSEAGSEQKKDDDGGVVTRAEKRAGTAKSESLSTWLTF